MGWTTIYKDKPSTNKEQAEVIKEVFDSLGYELKTEVLKHRLVGRVWYALIETTAPDSSKHKWFAICVTAWGKKAGDLSYKLMDQTCGPCYYDCPMSWFKDVPVANDYDQEWRAKCIEKQTRKKKANALGKTLKVGDIVRFDIAYDGETDWVYAGTSGCSHIFHKKKSQVLARLRNWNRHFVCINPTA